MSERDEVLVFAGDSITDAGRADDPEGLGNGYVRRLHRALAGTRGHIVNAGVAGDRVRDLRRRWTSEVLEARPTLLSIFIGVNDTWRRFDRDDPTSAEEYATDYRHLLDAAVSAGRDRFVIIEPFVLPVRPEQRLWLDDLAGKQAVAAALADEYGATFVPLQATLEGAGDHARLAPDGVHPSAEGSDLIARAWLDAVK